MQETLSTDTYTDRRTGMYVLCISVHEYCYIRPPNCCVGWGLFARLDLLRSYIHEHCGRGSACMLLAAGRHRREMFRNSMTQAGRASSLPAEREKGSWMA